MPPISPPARKRQATPRLCAPDCVPPTVYPRLRPRSRTTIKAQAHVRHRTALRHRLPCSLDRTRYYRTTHTSLAQEPPMTLSTLSRPTLSRPTLSRPTCPVAAYLAPSPGPAPLPPSVSRASRLPNPPPPQPARAPSCMTAPLAILLSPPCWMVI